MWARAVWRENKREEEGVIPDNWVNEHTKKIYWPRTANGERAISERWIPDNHWWSFDLIKVKLLTDNKSEAEGFNETTDAEDDNQMNKRARKQKTFNDFVTGSGLKNLGASTKKKSMKRKETQSTSVLEKDNLPEVPTKFKRHQETPNTSSLSTSVLDNLPEVLAKFRSHQETESASVLDKDNLPEVPTKFKKHQETTNTSSLSPSVLDNLPEVLAKFRSHQDSVCAEEDKDVPVSEEKEEDNSESLFSDFFESDEEEQEGEAEEELPEMSCHKRRGRDIFPMDNAKFQKKVIYLLWEIKEALKTQITTTEEKENLARFMKLETVEELRSLEVDLKDKGYATILQSQLQQIGGRNGADMVDNIMKRLLSDKLMSIINLSGKNQKWKLKDTGIYLVIVQAVQEVHGTTINEIEEKMRVTLKWAPYRKGGLKNKPSDE